MSSLAGAPSRLALTLTLTLTLTLIGWGPEQAYPDWLKESAFVTVFLHLSRFIDGERYFDPEARHNAHEVWATLSLTPTHA